jgi:hypothetical protein
MHPMLKRKNSTGLRNKLGASFIPRFSYQSGHRRMAPERNVALLAKQPADMMLAPTACDTDAKPVSTKAHLVVAVDAPG